MSMDKNPSTFTPSVHQSPSPDEVKRISDSLDFDSSQDLIKAYTEYISNSLKDLDTLDSVDGFIPDVKYPRTPGRKPRPEENPGNAWAWLCDIKGSPTGKLSGKTIAVKDNVAVAGVPMSNGSRVLKGYTPEYDATIISRILVAGGHIIGKSACDEFGCASMGYSCTDGFIHLPQTPEYRAGGSSGGSAVLVANGDVDMAIGGDQGGSVRIPAAWCGVVGFKPTFGLIPYTGIMSIEPTFDHTGPITKSIFDCALFLEVLAGSNGVDPRQPPDIVVPEYSKMLESQANVVLGKVTEGFACCDVNIQTIVQSFLGNLSSVESNISLTDVTTPLHNLAGAAIMSIHAQGTTTNLQMGTTPQLVDGFHSTSLQKAVVQGLKECPHLFSPKMKSDIIFGEYLRQRYGNHYYAKARNIVIDMRRQVDIALEKCDALVMPTLPFLPLKFVQNGPDFGSSLQKFVLDSSVANLNTRVYNLTGHPALSIPLSKTGDPFQPSLMIVGRKFDEIKVLQIGRMVEKTIQRL